MNLGRKRRASASRKGHGTNLASLAAAFSRNSAKLWILACAVTAVLPLVIRGASCGHDFDFHLQSWLAVAESWRHGLFYPHWIEGANYGAGEPRFVFYPPLTWMLGALLGIVLPWSAAPIAFTFLVLTACGLSMDKLARAYIPANAATIAACAYTLSPYVIFVAYERTAYGELAAGIWLPLIVLYAIRLTDGKLTRRPALQSEAERSETASRDLRFPLASTYPVAQRSPFRTRLFPSDNRLYLAITIAAIWLTNAPGAVMACYLLAAIALWNALSQRDWQPILQSVTSLLLGIGLVAFYLVPAAYERRWVDIARAVGPGMRIEDSFLFGYTGESFHDQVLRTASLIFITMTVSTVLAVSLAWRRHSTRDLLRPLLIAATVLLAMQLPWTDPIWRHAPELKFLQFPWRLSLLLSMAFAIAIGTATVPGRVAAKSGRRKAGVVVLAMIGLLVIEARLFWQSCDEEDAVSAQLAVFHSGEGFEGTDEYTPLGADNSLVPQSLPAVRVLNQSKAETATGNTEGQDNTTYAPDPQQQLPAQIQVQNWQAEHKSVIITTPSPAYAILRLMDYPAWQVQVNGVPIANRSGREDGLMVVPVEAGSNNIEIRYTATTDVLWGRALSVASLLALITLSRPKRPAIK